MLSKMHEIVWVRQWVRQVSLVLRASVKRLKCRGIIGTACLTHKKNMGENYLNHSSAIISTGSLKSRSESPDSFPNSRTAALFCPKQPETTVRRLFDKKTLSTGLRPISGLFPVNSYTYNVINLTININIWSKMHFYIVVYFNKLYAYLNINSINIL